MKLTLILSLVLASFSQFGLAFPIDDSLTPRRSETLNSVQFNSAGGNIMADDACHVEDITIQLYHDSEPVTFYGDYHVTCSTRHDDDFGDYLYAQTGDERSYMSLVRYPINGVYYFIGSIVDLDTKKLYSISLQSSSMEYIVKEYLSGDFPLEEDPEDDTSRRLSQAQRDFIRRGKDASPVDANRRLQTTPVIDILVVWTETAECELDGQSSGCTLDGTTEANMRALIQQGFSESNAAYTTSGIDAELRLAHAYRHPTYSDNGISSSTVLSTVQDSADGTLDDVLDVREQYCADMVAMIVGNKGTNCGIAYVNSGTIASFSAAFMISVTSYNCITPNYSFEHEVGHNLGCQHNRQDSGVTDACTTTTQTAFGWRDPDGDFRTIMATECDGPACTGAGFLPSDSCTRILQFSSATVQFSGQAAGDALNSCAARINDVAADVAALRDSTLCEVPSAAPSLSGMPSAAPSLSIAPSTKPSSQPSMSMVPSLQPSSAPSISASPSLMPSTVPSIRPTPDGPQPSSSPSVSNMPSISISPSLTPSGLPSISAIPSSKPSSVPSISAVPSLMPTSSPSLSSQPSLRPSSAPSISIVPSASSAPSLNPSQAPSLSAMPSSQPSSTPSVSMAPSGAPSSAPSISSVPTGQPSISNAPSSAPSSDLSANPTTVQSCAAISQYTCGYSHENGEVEAGYTSVCVRNKGGNVFSKCYSNDKLGDVEAGDRIPGTKLTVLNCGCCDFDEEGHGPNYCDYTPIECPIEEYECGKRNGKVQVKYCVENKRGNVYTTCGNPFTNLSNGKEVVGCGRSCDPLDQSQAPSVAPSVSQVPTISLVPTTVPSAVPSDSPTTESTTCAVDRNLCGGHFIKRWYWYGYSWEFVEYHSVCIENTRRGSFTSECVSGADTVEVGDYINRRDRIADCGCCGDDSGASSKDFCSDDAIPCMQEEYYCGDGNFAFWYWDSSCDEPKYYCGSPFVSLHEDDYFLNCGKICQYPDGTRDGDTIPV